MLNTCVPASLLGVVGMPKRTLAELYGVTKNNAAVTTARVVGLAVEVGLRKSKDQPPLRAEHVRTVAFSHCEERGAKLSVLEIELPDDLASFVVRLVLGIRTVLSALHLNVSRVDQRRRAGGEDGSHDLVMDMGGVMDAVGEVKCRRQSLKNGEPYSGYLFATCREVLAEYEATRRSHFPDKAIAVLCVCLMYRRLGGPWNASLRVALWRDNAWYSAYQYPCLGQLVAPVMTLPRGELPSLGELRDMALQRIEYPMAQALQLPLQAQQPAAVVQQPAAAAQQPALPAPQPALPAQPPAAVAQQPGPPVALWTAHVPPRVARPLVKPATFDAAWELCTKFQGRQGVTVCLVQDFLNIMHRDNRHCDQTVARWRGTVPLCQDDAHLFRLGRRLGVSGSAPDVATEDALRAVHLAFSM